MKELILLLAVVQLCLTMPMTSNLPQGVRPQCVDSENNRYNIGLNFRRVTDGWICNCTYDNGITRLYCKSPALFPSTYYPQQYNPVLTYEERQRALRKDFCIYERNGQLQYVKLNTEWRMLVNGVLMNCRCSQSARMSCTAANQVINPPKDTTNRLCQTGAHRSGEKFPVRQAGGYYALCTCVSNDTADCQVLTTSGRQCQFPFNFGSNYYSTCAFLRSRRAPLCVTENGRTSNCITNLNDFRTYLGDIITYGGNANGAMCRFPFTVNGISYNQCTTVRRNRLWCSTTSNYNRDRRYGYCQQSSTSTSTSTGTATNPQAESAIYRKVGQPAIIECRFQRPTGSAAPTITWYKLTGGTRRQKLYTYHSFNQTGYESESAGSYRGRLNMPNERQLVISNMRVDDGGTFECEVNYVGSEEVLVRTDVSISNGPSSSSSLKYTYYPKLGETEFSWNNPGSDYDSMRFEYQQEGGRVVKRVNVPRGRNRFSIRDMRPGIVYLVRLYTINDGQESAPTQMTFTIPRFSTNERPSTGSSRNEPLTAPRSSESTIFLNWLSNPFVDVEVGEWIIVYVDGSTGEVRNVTLSSTEDNYLLENLSPGRRYRVKLYAVVDGNQIEVDAKDLATEESSFELPRAPLTEASTSTITLTWDPPESFDATSYEISYRSLKGPSTQWITYTVSASDNPRDVIRNLMPGTRYDIHITPIRGTRRGDFFPIVANTEDLPSEPSDPVLPPRNLVVEEISRSSFLIRWDPPNYSGSFRYRIRHFPEGNPDEALEYTVSSPRFRATGLNPSQDYTIQVFTILGSDESEPATASTLTSNEVCRVDNVWRGENEKFYKMNPAGYLQNCTCYKTLTGGRWVCDPIICVSRSGKSYVVSNTWQQENEEGDYYENCTCTRAGTQCRNSGPINRPNRPSSVGQIGDRMTLQCPHETDERIRPTIMWYKLTSAGKVPIYRYNGMTQLGTALVESGQQFSRLSMRNEVELVIDSLAAGDSATYQCAVQYPSTTATTYHQTDINVIPRNRPVKVSLIYPPQVARVTRNQITLTWESPSELVTSYQILYRDENDVSAERLLTVEDESVVLEDLSPSTTYIVTVIPIVDETAGQPTIITVTTDDEYLPTDLTPSTTPLSPVSPPTNLRFEDVRLTSFRARWSIPLSIERVDFYRVKYKAQNSEDQYTMVDSFRNFLTIRDLIPGEAYIVRVQSVRDDVESSPITRVANTRKIGNIPVRVTNGRQSSVLGSVVGSSATLICNFNLRLPGNPNVTWYKIGGDGIRKALATFDENLETGEEFSEARTAGELSGRLQIVNPSTLTISNLQSSDQGSYECAVTYPTGSGSGRIKINIIGLPNPVVFVSPLIGSEETEYTLRWTADSAPRIREFLLSVRRRGSSSGRYSEFRPPGSARSFQFRNLRSGYTYEGYMTARNQYGSSPRTAFNFTTASSGLPGPPRTLSLVSRTPTQLSVKVAGATGDVSFYRIRYGPESPTNEIPEQTVEGTSPDDVIVLANLVPNTAYILRVSAVNNVGESEVLAGRTTTPKELPNPPTGVTITELTARKAVLVFEGSMEGVDHYEVSFQPTYSYQTKRTQRTRRGENNVTLMFLQPETQYRIEVRSVNNNGRSGIVRATFSTLQELPIPSRPRQFTSVHPQTDRVTLEWNGDTRNVQYYVVEFQAEGETDRQIRTTLGPIQRAVITGLSPNTQYQVSVKAIGLGGQSPVLIGRFTTSSTAPRINHVTVNQTDSNEATIEIEETPNAADYYIVTYFPVNDEEQSSEVISRSRKVTFSNLLPSTTYRVQVVAVLGDDRSEPITTEFITNEQTNTNHVTTPGGFVVTSKESEEAEVDWQAVPQADYYRVEYKNTFPNRGSPQVFNVYPPNTRATLRNLVPGTDYQVKVYAITGTSRSEPASATFVTRIDQPTNLRYVSGRSGTTIYWDNPTGPLAGIRVFYRKGSFENSVLLTEDSTQYSIPYISSQEPIHVEVTAVGENTESNPATLDINLRSRPTLRGVYLDNVSDRRADVMLRIADDIERNGWILTLSDQDGVVGSPQNIPDDASSVPLSNLQSGHVYVVSIMDQNGLELTQNEFMTKVSKPRNVQFGEINHNSALLTWDPPPGVVTGYLVRYKTYTDSSWSQREVIEPEFRLNNLKPDSLYNVLIFALYRDTVMERNENGIPTFENLRTLPLPEAGNPRPVRNLSATNIRSRSVTLQWDPSLDRDVQQYRIEIRRGDGTLLGTSTTLEDSYTYSLLSPDTNYIAIVKSIRAGYESLPVSQAFRTPASRQPLVATVENVDDSSFDVAWSHSAPGVTRYIVSIKKTDSRDVPITQSTSGDLRSLRFFSLHPATTYDITVIPVINGRQASPVRTSATTELPSPINLSVDRVTSTAIRLRWNQPNNEIEDYLVTYRPSTNNDGYQQAVEGQTQTTLSELKPNTEYVIAVYSIYENRRSSPNTVMETTLALAVPPPQNVEITDVQSPRFGSSSISLRWQRDPTYNYMVTATTEGETDPVIEEFVIDSDEAVIDGLLPATNYIIKVIAVDISTNQQSNPVVIRKKTIPRTPMNVRLVNVGESSIEFTWPVNEVDNVTETGYLFKYRPEGRPMIERRIRKPQIILSNLQPLTTYRDFSVQSIVNGELSDPYRFPDVVQTGSLPSPTDLNVSPQPESGVGSYLVSWEPIDNYNGSYELTYHPGDQSQTRRITTQPQTTYVRLSNLLPGVGYVISVYPSSSNSLNSTATTRLIIPVPRPKNVVIQDISATQATVIFSAPTYDTVSLYEVRYYPVGRKSQLQLKRVEPQQRKRVVLTDLEPDTEYRVNVITYAGLKFSSPTGRNFATVSAPTETPTEPLPPSVGEDDGPVNADRIDDQTYRVRWREFDGPVRYYKVAYRRYSGGQTSRQAVPKYTNEIHLNLMQGENYYVTVTAVMSNGTFYSVGNTNIETNGGGLNGRSAIIEWDQASYEIVRYFVTAKPLRNPSARTLTWKLDGNENSLRLIGLHPGTHYQIVVVGQTDENRNVSVLQTTLDTAVDSPRNLQVTRTTPNSISVQWNKPEAPIDGYTLTYQTDGGRETSHVPAPSVSDERATLRNLRPGKRYMIRLYATSLIVPEDSLPAETVGETPVPPPPRFHTPQITPNLVGLVWDKPHEEVTHYTLTIRDGKGNAVLRNHRIEGNTTSYTIRQLQPRSRYQFEITAWAGDSQSRSVTRTVVTSRRLNEIRSNSTSLTNKGDEYLLRWRGRSRGVEGWLLVIEPDDGSEPTEVRVDRFTKRYKLENLRSDISYTIRIYPYSGDTRGRGSIVKIPASSTRTVTSTVWQMQIPRIETDSVLLQWNTPWYGSEVEEYALMYKLQNEPDSSYIYTQNQPRPGDNSITINNLEPGESYSIRLKAFHSGGVGQDRLSLTLIANITTPFPPPSEVQMQQLPNGTTVISWQPSTVPITAYVIQYRVQDGSNTREFVTRRIRPSKTNIFLTFLKPGKSYEIRFFAEKGAVKSTAVSFRLDMPDQPAAECTDPETNQVYQVGQTWVSEAAGFRLNCSCSGPQTYNCDTGEWCHVDDKVYNLGEKWTNIYEETNKKEVCVCKGRAGYLCYPRNCQENGMWYDEGRRWRSTLDGISCVCSCPTQITQPCTTSCNDG